MSTYCAQVSTIVVEPIKSVPLINQKSPFKTSVSIPIGVECKVMQNGVETVSHPICAIMMPNRTSNCGHESVVIIKFVMYSKHFTFGSCLILVICISMEF